MPVFSQARQSRPFYIEDVYAPTSQVLSATFNEPLTYGELWNYSERFWSDVFSTRPLTEEQIKERVGTLPLDVKPGISAQSLNILIEQKKAELERQRVYTRAQGGIAEGTLRFGAALAASFTDPLEFAANFFPVMKSAKYAKMLEGAATPLARAGVRAKVGAIEGAVGAAALEPARMFFAGERQGEYGIEDSFLNIVLGGAMGGGIHTFGGAIKDAVIRPPKDSKIAADIDNLSRDTQHQALKTATRQFAAGREVDVSLIIESDPRFSYLSGARVGDVPEGVGGRPVKDRVSTSVEKEIRVKSQEVETKYEGALLTKGERKALEGEVKNLEASIKKSEEQIAKRSATDSVRKGHTTRLKKTKPRLKEVKETLARDTSLREQRQQELRGIEADKTNLEKYKAGEAPRLEEWSPTTRESIMKEMDTVHRERAKSDLQRAISAEMKMRSPESNRLGIPQEESIKIQKQVDEAAHKELDDELDEGIQYMEGKIAEIDDPVLKEEIDQARAEVADLEKEASEIDGVLKKWATCRNTNG